MKIFLSEISSQSINKIFIDHYWTADNKKKRLNFTDLKLSQKFGLYPRLDKIRSKYYSSFNSFS